MLLFFWLPSPEMAKERVAKRVSEGGHNIPLEAIVRRYWLGLHNFFQIFARIVDSWMFYENVETTTLLASNITIIENSKFQKIKDLCQTKKI